MVRLFNQYRDVTFTTLPHGSRKLSEPIIFKVQLLRCKPGRAYRTKRLIKAVFNITGGSDGTSSYRGFEFCPSSELSQSRNFLNLILFIILHELLVFLFLFIVKVFVNSVLIETLWFLISFIMTVRSSKFTVVYLLSSMARVAIIKQPVFQVRSHEGYSVIQISTFIAGGQLPRICVFHEIG